MSEHINTLDVDKDNIIEVNELLDALKPGGFLSKEENIKIISVELKTLLKNTPIKQTLLDSFEKILQDFNIKSNPYEWNKIYQTYQTIGGEKNFLTPIQPSIATISKIFRGSNSILLSEQPKQLSLQVMQFDEKFSTAGLNKIYNWVKNNDPNFAQKEGIIRKRFYDKGEDYIKREMLSYALEQHGALLEQKIHFVAFNAGYKNLNKQDEIQKDQQLYEDFQKMIARFALQYPGYEPVVQKVEKQQQKIQTIMKKYGLNQEKIASIMTAYETEQKKLASNPLLKAAIQRINTIDFNTITSESLKQYFTDVEFIQNQSKSKVQGMQEVQKFYNSIKPYKITANDQQVYKTYTQTINTWFSDPIRNALANAPLYNPNKTPEELRFQRNLEKKMNPNGVSHISVWDRIQRYNTYINSYVKENIHLMTKDYEGLQKTIMGLYTNPENQNYLLKIKYDKQKALEKQKGIDATHAMLKQSNPILYQAGNLGRGVWEGWWRGVGGIYKGLKTGYHMIAGTNQDDIKYDMQHINQISDGFSGEQFQSSSMNKSLVMNSKLSMGIDNTTNQVGQQISNMIILLTGGGAAGKGLQVLGMGAKIAPKIGLMTSAMSMQIGNYFDNAIQLGLNPKDAFGYALVQGGVSSGLELISPNSAFLGKFKINTGALFTQVNKKFVVQYMKNMGKELGQEVVQEETQMLAEKGLNHIFNTGYNKNFFDTELSFAEIYSTAIITGITTGMVTSKGKYNETKINQQSDIYVNFLHKNPLIKTQQIQYIDKLIVQNSKNQPLVEYYRDLKVKIEFIDGKSDNMKTIGIINNETIEPYFGKESRFGFTENLVNENSAFMDQFTTQATPKQITQIRDKIQTVAKIYTEKTGKSLTLTDGQIQTIIAAHLKPGELGNLSAAELKAKVELLAATIPDPDVRRFLLEAGFCGMKEFAVNAVLWIKSRKERRTPMRAVLALNALIILNSVDNVKTNILHKSIDVTQHMYTALEKQSHDIQSIEQGFTNKIEQSKEQFDEMVETYKSFLIKAKEYNDTRLGQGLNRMSNGSIDEAIAKAESGKFALENTQNIVGDVNAMMEEIKLRTDASLQIAKNMESTLKNAHEITDLTLNILQIISLITLLYQVFYAYGLYHSKEGKTKEQQVMIKNMKIGIVASAISLLVFYGKINPEMQSWANEVTQKLQTLDDMIIKK